VKFEKYPHIEKLGHAAVQGLEYGTVHVFPKIDGTNASMWIHESEGIQVGGRKRLLSKDKDNAGFHEWMEEGTDSAPYIEVFGSYPELRLYGEWLVPHTFKGYREETWHNFYVFDIYDHSLGEFIHYDRLVELANRFGFKYIPALAIIDHPTKEQLVGLLDSNNYLCTDEAGAGEGLVLKRYGFVNKFGRTTWAKMVRAEFKDKHRLAMPIDTTQGAMTLERDAVEKYVTKAFVDKERAKIEIDLENKHFKGGPHLRQPEQWIILREEYIASRECRKTLIPRLLQTVYFTLVTEHTWDIVGKKNCIIDFKTLRRMTIEKTKLCCPDLF
jgi:hypothetical protein